MGYQVVIVPFLNVDGMAVYPFILLKKADYKNDAILIRHETIHLKQQREMLVLLFYLVYLAGYLYYLAKLRNHNKAYRSIIFEREAYAHEHDANYITKRTFWAFLKA